MKVILAPHGDDEILGCFSILDQIDRIVYFTYDYRVENQIIVADHRYIGIHGFVANYLADLSYQDTLYLPSKYDYHPLHREVRRTGLGWPGKKMFYSVEMNTPWLEEETDPVGKRALFEKLYPGEVATISKSDKYFLFKSIQPFDDLIWATVRFTREFFHRWPAAPAEVAFLANRHRHLLHFEVRLQQFGDDRDVEYFILTRKVQAWFDDLEWPESTSCEMIAIKMKWWLETTYRDRQVQVSVYEDTENGCVIE